MQRNFKASEIAEICDTSKVTILKHRRQGKFPHARMDKFAGAYRFPRGDVREYCLTEHGIILEEAEEARDHETQTQE